jgi:DNA (cytosine-5)-methyltransferase 1
MIRHLEEIEQVLKNVDMMQADDASAKYFLSNIAFDSNEEDRKIIIDYINQNIDSLSEKYKFISGYTSELCLRQKCSLCSVKKWCGKFRAKIQKKEIHRTGFVYADFFCGAGGLSLGFKSAGFKLSLANDIQECCIDTYRFNHPETPTNNIVAGDINDILANVEKYRRFSDIDVVAGGPPCQGFSMANRQRLIDDPRNHLYKSYVAVINKLHPKFIVMENVRGILSVMDQIDADFSAIGYRVKAKLLNAKDFGIPQNRERVIVIGNCLGIDNESIFCEILGKSSKMASANLEDAIADLRPLDAKRRKNNTEIEDSKSGFNIAKKEVALESDYVKFINRMGDTSILFNHKARYNNDRDIEIFSRLEPGDNSTDPKISDIMPYKRRERIFKDKYFKLEMDKPCKTITAHMKYDCNMYIHPNQARGLTPREAARVQSFPDDYFFRGSYTKTYMQIGNSVPPLLSKTIAEVIKNRLEGLNGCI